jgi:hypothetical protein
VVDQAKAQKARKTIDGLPMLLAGLGCRPRYDMRPLFVILVKSLNWIALLVDCGTIGLETEDRVML